IPIASDPPIPIAATFNVAFSPVQKSGMCSQMKCQSKLATRVIGPVAPERPPSGSRSGRVTSRTDARDVLADRVGEGVLRSWDVVQEVGHQPSRRIRLQDLHELVLLLHVAQGG